MVETPHSTRWCKSSAHSRRLKTDTFTSLTDSQLDRATDNAALGCTLGLAFTNEESALRTKTIATLVTIEAALVPLTTNCADDNLVHDMLLAAQTTGCGTARVAVETPCEAVFLDKRSLGIEGLYEEKIVSCLACGSGSIGKEIHTYITALCAEEVADMPFGTACYYHFSFNGSLAALATGAEQLVEIQVAVEPRHTGLLVMSLGCC